MAPDTSTPKPASKRPPQCRKCANPMKGHSRVTCPPTAGIPVVTKGETVFFVPSSAQKKKRADPIKKLSNKVETLKAVETNQVRRAKRRSSAASALQAHATLESLSGDAKALLGAILPPTFSVLPSVQKDAPPQVIPHIVVTSPSVIIDHHLAVPGQKKRKPLVRTETAVSRAAFIDQHTNECTTWVWRISADDIPPVQDQAEMIGFFTGSFEDSSDSDKGYLVIGRNRDEVQRITNLRGTGSVKAAAG